MQEAGPVCQATTLMNWLLWHSLALVVRYSIFATNLGLNQREYCRKMKIPRGSAIHYVSNTNTFTLTLELLRAHSYLPTVTVNLLAASSELFACSCTSWSQLSTFLEYPSHLGIRSPNPRALLHAEFPSPIAWSTLRVKRIDLGSNVHYPGIILIRSTHHNYRNACEFKICQTDSIRFDRVLSNHYRP